jgi:hypothetical protein
VNTHYYSEEWRGEQRISPPGDNFAPRGQNSPLGNNFAPSGEEWASVNFSETFLLIAAGQIKFTAWLPDGIFSNQKSQFG